MLMEQKKIAVQLRVLLDSIRDMKSAIEDANDDLMSLRQGSAARELIAHHESLATACFAWPLHYKTRIKLLRVVDQATGLVALCRLLTLTTLPKAFDLQNLRVELVSMCKSVALTLEPVTDYYARERQPQGQGVSGATRRVDMFESSPSRRNSYGSNTLSPILQMKHFHGALTNPVVRKAAKRPAVVAFEDCTQHLKIGSTEVPVYFGTMRDITDNPEDEAAARFLNGRGSGEFALGRALISIPPGHRVGKLEQPLSIWKLRMKPNPEKHVVLRSAEPMDASAWVSAVRKELDDLPQRMAFVFIHGFNVTFSQSMMRAGQIARDIGYEGLVTAFSWGSVGTVDGYSADEDTVRLAVPKLVEFLAKLRTETDVETFHIVAHSMGCRALLSALKDTSWWNTKVTPVAEAVFAAPDVDATEFRQNMMEIPLSAGRYTLYGSERDWAIAVSRSIRKNHARAGEGGKNILVVNGVQTVDATEVGESMFGLGHSYIADKRTILGDLWAVLRGTKMTRFGLRERQHSTGKYWALVP